jgi:hypothetical protein
MFAETSVRLGAAAMHFYTSCRKLRYCRKTQWNEVCTQIMNFKINLEYTACFNALKKRFPESTVRSLCYFRTNQNCVPLHYFL